MKEITSIRVIHGTLGVYPITNAEYECPYCHEITSSVLWHIAVKGPQPSTYTCPQCKGVSLMKGTA